MTDYDAKKIAEELRSLKSIKEDRDYYKKAYEDLQKQNRYNAQEEKKKRSSIVIGGYSGIAIPLDEEIKKSINEYIATEIRNIIESDKDFEETFIKCALNYRKAFINIFKPIVKDMVEDMDFTVRFDTDE